MSRPIARPVLIALLALGAVGGLVLVVLSHRHGFGHHPAFERKIADVCTESALRVFERRSSDTTRAAE